MFKKIATYFSINIYSTLVGIVLIPLLTRYIEPEEMGFIGIYQSIIYISRPLMSMRSEGLVGINYVKLNKKNYQYFFNSLITLSIIIFIISLLLTQLSAFFFPYYRLTLLFAILVGFSRLLNEIHSQVLIQESSAGLFAKYRILNTTLQLILLFIFLVLLKWSWIGRLMSILLSEIIIFIIRIRTSGNYFSSFKLSINKELFKEIISYGYPLIIALGASWIIFQGDKIIVLKFFSMKELGLYTIAYTIGRIIDQLNQSYINSITPIIYKNLNGKRAKSDTTKYFLYYIFFLLIIVIIMGITFYNFSGIILGAKYYNSRVVTIIILFAYFFFGIYRVYGLVINYYKKTKLKAKIMYVIAIINISISLGLLPVLGKLAPAIGTLGAFFFLSIISIYYANREFHFNGIK